MYWTTKMYKNPADAGFIAVSRIFSAKKNSEFVF